MRSIVGCLNPRGGLFESIVEEGAFSEVALAMCVKEERISCVGTTPGSGMCGVRRSQGGGAPRQTSRFGEKGVRRVPGQAKRL